MPSRPSTEEDWHHCPQVSHTKTCVFLLWLQNAYPGGLQIATACDLSFSFGGTWTSGLRSGGGRTLAILTRRKYNVPRGS